MSAVAQPTRPSRSTSPQTRTINVRIPVSVFNQLDELATATARTKSFVTVEALSSYLEAQAWQVKEVQEAIVEADNGDFATDDQVDAVFAKYGA
jgi:RHH-type transcriptional regulator, rel operon repressor / antitoxin RelB